MNSARIDYVALTTPDLVVRARGGDPDAFRIIMQRANQRLFRVARAVLRDEIEAEDALQDAYVRAFTHLESFRGDSSLSTWLFRIVRNLQIDARRRSAHRDAEAGFPDGDDGWAVDEDGVQPDAYADHVGLDRAIRGLPAAQARLIRMAYLEARSHSEIAAELGMPLGSVKSTLRRAFARLKAGLGAGP